MRGIPVTAMTAQDENTSAERGGFWLPRLSFYEVQLYRAAEALLTVITTAALTVAQCEAILRLCCMMDNTELHFYMAFDMEIDDKRTVYGECARSLVPREDEPSVCLMHDWINLPSA